MEDENEMVGPAYFRRWEAPVCALIIAVPTIAAAVLISKAKSDPLRAVDLWAPCWRKLHPVWLLAYRVLVFLLMSFIFSQSILLHGVSSLYFYTELTFALVVVYFAIASLISIHGCWIYSNHATGNDEANGYLRRDVEENRPAALTSEENENQYAIKFPGYIEHNENERKAGFWGYTMQIVYQTSAGAVMLTDIVFWGLLVPFLAGDYFKVNLMMACMHSLNAVFLLLDALLNRMPFPWFRMAYFVFWSALYITFQWILHASGFQWWPYPFLELATPWAPMWYLCMALAHIPCYGFFALILKAKSSLFPKFFPNAYVTRH